MSNDMDKEKNSHFGMKFLLALVIIFLIIGKFSGYFDEYSKILSPGSSNTTVATVSNESQIVNEKALFDLPALADATEEQLAKALGKRKSRTESFATYKPDGCEEVMVRITDGKAATFTIYFSSPASSPEAALARVGIKTTTPPSDTAPLAAWWRGNLPGVPFAEVGAMSNTGARSWDGVQAK